MEREVQGEQHKTWEVQVIYLDLNNVSHRCGFLGGHPGSSTMMWQREPYPTLCKKGWHGLTSTSPTVAILTLHEP
jgi:hypothetical protein